VSSRSWTPRDWELARSFVANMDAGDPDWHADIAVAALLLGERERVLAEVRRVTTNLRRQHVNMDEMLDLLDELSGEESGT
jgi:hypothetical protein